MSIRLFDWFEFCFKVQHEYSHFSGRDWNVFALRKWSNYHKHNDLLRRGYNLKRGPFYRYENYGIILENVFAAVSSVCPVSSGRGYY